MDNRKLHILFVCIENSNRSQMAQAFAKMYGADKIVAYSAGSAPSGKINPKAIEAMKELSYDLTTHVSKSLTDIPLIDYEYVVTMGCGDACPWIPAKHRIDWALPDPKNLNKKEFNKVRDTIAQNVKQLLSKI